MNQWYFAKDGKQEGPVTAHQIAALARAGVLHSSETLVWRDGLADWKSLAESGVLEEAGPLPVAQTANPYQVTKRSRSALAVERPDAPLEYPGYGRLKYITVSIVATIVFYGLLFVGIIGAASTGDFSGGVMALGFALFLIFGVFGIHIAVRRLQNLGMSGWAFLWLFVPVMTIWISWRMMVCPAGYEDHRTLDTAGKVLTGLFVGFIILAVIAQIYVGLAAA